MPSSPALKRFGLFFIKQSRAKAAKVAKMEKLFFLGLCRSQTFKLVGMPRGGVPARSGAEGGTNVVRLTFLVVRFRRLTLRSATGTAQRAVPTNFSTIVCERHNPAFPSLPSRDIRNGSFQVWQSPRVFSLPVERGMLGWERKGWPNIHIACFRFTDKINALENQAVTSKNCFPLHAGPGGNDFG